MGNNEFVSKGEWIQRKNQERDECYEKIEESANITKNDGKMFKQYLDIQSRFNNYSVGNSLLISLQMPTTTVFKDKENWNKSGVTINENAISFKILEPSSPIEKPDGTKATYYNPKEMYDISQTDAKPKDNTILYSDKELLKAFIQNCPAKVIVVDELEDKTLGAKYDVNRDILYVCRGMDTNILFQSISYEFSKILRKDDEINSNLIDFEAYCTSYMICKKYGKSVSNYNFNKLPQELKDMDVKDFRTELSTIRNSMNDIVIQLDEYLNKSQRNKVLAR